MDVKFALKLSSKSKDSFVTIGLSPSLAMEPLKENKDNKKSENQLYDEYFDQIRDFLKDPKSKGKFIAIGECGLDYARLNLADLDH